MAAGHAQRIERSLTSSTAPRLEHAPAENNKQCQESIQRAKTAPFPLRLLLIFSAIRADFRMKFHKTVKQSNVHFIAKFG